MSLKGRIGVRTAVGLIMPRMVISMDQTKLRTITQLQEFVVATPEVSFLGAADGARRKGLLPRAEPYPATARLARAGEGVSRGRRRQTKRASARRRRWRLLQHALDDSGLLPRFARRSERSLRVNELAPLLFNKFEGIHISQQNLKCPFFL